MRVLRNPHETTHGTWQVFEVHWHELSSDLRVEPALCVTAQGEAGQLVVCRVRGADTLKVADKRVRAYIDQCLAYSLKPGVFTVLKPS